MSGKLTRIGLAVQLVTGLGLGEASSQTVQTLRVMREKRGGLPRLP